jgi:hypothetical protein
MYTEDGDSPQVVGQHSSTLCCLCTGQINRGSQTCIITSVEEVRRLTVAAAKVEETSAMGFLAETIVGLEGPQAVGRAVQEVMSVDF